MATVSVQVGQILKGFTPRIANFCSIRKIWQKSVWMSWHGSPTSLYSANLSQIKPSRKHTLYSSMEISYSYIPHEPIVQKAIFLAFINLSGFRTVKIPFDNVARDRISSASNNEHGRTSSGMVTRPKKLTLSFIQPIALGVSWPTIRHQNRLTNIRGSLETNSGGITQPNYIKWAKETVTSNRRLRNERPLPSFRCVTAYFFLFSCTWCWTGRKHIPSSSKIELAEFGVWDIWGESTFGDNWNFVLCKAITTELYALSCFTSVGTILLSHGSRHPILTKSSVHCSIWID